MNFTATGTVEEIAAAWARRAEALADWALSRLVVRKDVYGAYRPDGGQYTAHAEPTRELIVRHFRGDFVIGAHTTSTDGRCLALAIDIDAHDDQADTEANWRFALALVDRLARLGVRALIFDSNGKGGYHVRAFFKKSIPSEVAFWLAQRLVADHADHGFKSPPETFPKQAERTLECPYGNWIRLPGKHHKRAHWTRIYDPERRRWLDGKAAVDRLIKIAGDDTGKVLAAYRAEEKARAEAEGKAEGKPGDAGSNGQERTRAKSRAKRRRDEPADEATVRAALDHLPDDWANSYGGTRTDTGWLGVGMALHDWDPVLGLDLWKEFSARCKEKFDPAVCEAKWATFTQGCGLTVGTIFKEAQRCGWIPPWIGQRPPPAAARYEGNGDGPHPAPDGSNNHHGDHHEGGAPRGSVYKRLTDAEMGIVTADSVAMEQVEQLWPDRIYLGKIDLLAGDGGHGKSQHAARVGASVTRPDLAFPDGVMPTITGKVLILAAEDGQRDTVLPRLAAAGADLSNVIFITAKVTTRGRDGTPLIHFASFQDLDYWREVFRRVANGRLLIADPLPAFLGRGINDHRNQEVRTVLEPFAELLSESRVAMQGITHMGKSPDLKSPTHKILGSVAYSNLARTVHVTAHDPDVKGRRILCQVKNNLGPLQPALAFRIEEFHVDYRGTAIRTSRVVFEDAPIEADAAELFGGPKRKPGPDPEKTRLAAEWLFDHLTAAKGPTPLAAIFDAAGEKGFAGVKKEDGKWSNVAVVYRARDMIATLPAPRDKATVADLEAPIRDGGRNVKHWYIIGADEPF